jgi:multicomponent Na+:H+ antiporter subunit D
VSSLLNAGYFVPVVFTSFFGKPLPGDTTNGRFLEGAPLIMFMVVPLFLTALGSVAFGVYPNLFINIIHLMLGK